MSCLFGCTDLLAEPGILRTRAGVARIFSDATAQGLRLRRRRRLSPPAPSASRTSGRPGAAGPAPMRPGDIIRPGPECAHSRPGETVLASGPTLLPAGRWTSRIRDWRPGGGTMRPDRRSGRHTSLRPAGRGSHQGGGIT